MRRAVFALAALLCSALPCLAAEPAAFPRTTIDLGCMVSDIDASARFYTDGIGFRERIARSMALRQRCSG